MGEKEVVLSVVPMFHVNAWGLPYSCTMAGAKQVLPGPMMIGKPIAELIESERVTSAAGVPTIWALLYQYLKEEKGRTYDLSSLKTILVGGAAASQTLVDSFEKDLGLPILHAWGMTETSPIGTVSRLKSTMQDWTDEQKLAVRLKQGIPVVGVEVRILDDHGQDLPWDGEHAGELVVRGPWIASSYYNNPGGDGAFTADGWFRTGDIAMIDRHGYVQITDRKKDLIKRKGEWISSVDMENLVLAHPGVLEAAVVGRVCDVRDEVPVVFVVTKPDLKQPIEAQEIIDLIGTKFALWQLPKPEDIRFVAIAAQDRRRQAGQEGDSQDAGELNRLTFPPAPSGVGRLFARDRSVAGQVQPSRRLHVGRASGPARPQAGVRRPRPRRRPSPVPSPVPLSLGSRSR